MDSQSEPKYDITIKNLQYNNDAEYRKTLRRLFCMISPQDIETDIDVISQDEQDFDPAAAEHMMDYIYDKTKDNETFQQLYDSAASKMISMDRSIGLAVLCSYDYLGLFHKCLCAFFENPDNFNESTDEYVSLSKKMS